ncbi:MAG: hypothetical protein WBP59_03830 [Ilumatobacteraceae bacterium]
MATPRLAHAAATIALCTLAVTGCMTGPRPSFDDDQPLVTATGDPAIDAVLDRLDSVDVALFTADYTILTRLGGLESTATVVHADNSRQSITINDIRFIDGPGTASTCNLTTQECEATINDARVSDTQIGHDFYGASFARRLRVDAGRRIGDATGYEITQAGQPGVCADVPVSGGTKSYCALDTGALARYDGADVLIDLIAYSPTPDETKFATN